ncbi:MAG TPA: Rne/Rng family ribonuclease, partial [Candidatus Krumholzibacteria bacterium]|nr:Rne/Rng family ribonuclease [Candidatus Krumholzibacteria bacterium]
MLKEIVVNSTPNEIRIGIVEDRELVELLSESADATRMVGNLYKGKVTAVRPGLQAAFVDIGFDKAGFLHVSDLIHEEPDDDDDHHGGRRRSRGREGMRPIERMLREGDEILVQVVKEPIGTKGPRLTADVSLPGRFLVLMPKGSHVGVSRKIADRKERSRLKEMLSSVRPGEGAYIIRTAGEGIDEKMLRKDVEYLSNAWTGIKQKMTQVKAPAVVHEDVGLIVGLIRDVLTEDVDAVHIDNEQDYNRLANYVRNFAPRLQDRIKLYRGDMALFDKYDIESELKKSLERKVWMKKGGYIVVDPTEALVAIDVNTGRFTGKRNQEETIFKTNMIAAREIPRQLRLRDIGGIIIIDFIDMESEANKRKVLNELRTYLKRDRARTKTFNVSDLGLVEMSRQRVRESLQARLSDDCPFCHATGHILSLDTLSNKVERLLSKCGLVTQENAVQVQASPSLAIHLLTHRGEAVEKIARGFNMKIDILDDARIHREEFKIVSLRNRKDLTSQLETAVWKGTVTRRRSTAAVAAEGQSTDHQESGGRDAGESSRPSRSRRGGSNRDRRSESGSGESGRGGRSRRTRSSSSRGGSQTDESSGQRQETSSRGSSNRQDSQRADSRDSRRSSSRRDSRRSSSANPERDAERKEIAAADEQGTRTSQSGSGETRSHTEDHPRGANSESETGKRPRRRRRGRRGRGRGRGAAKGAETNASSNGSAAKGGEGSSTSATGNAKAAHASTRDAERVASNRSQPQSSSPPSKPSSPVTKDAQQGDSREKSEVRSRSSRGSSSRRGRGRRSSG